MSAEAIARLRAFADFEWSIGKGEPVVMRNDLRALLDAHVALQKDADQVRMEADVHAATLREVTMAHTEALDALALFVHTGDEFADDYDAKAQARAVLAKAGRR